MHPHTATHAHDHSPAQSMLGHKRSRERELDGYKYKHLKCFLPQSIKFKLEFRMPMDLGARAAGEGGERRAAVGDTDRSVYCHRIQCLITCSLHGIELVARAHARAFTWCAQYIWGVCSVSSLYSIFTGSHHWVRCCVG